MAATDTILDGYTAASAELAERTFTAAGERGTGGAVRRFFRVDSAVAPAPADPGTPSPSDFSSMLNNMGTAPGATTVATVPAAPATGDMALVNNVQTLDSYISTLTAMVLYHNHPAMYDLSDKQQATQFVVDLANARNYVVTGGVIKAIPMYLPMGQASTQTISKSTTSADLHVDLLSALFGSLGLPPAVFAEMDGILTEVSDSLKTLQLTFTAQTQTLNHFISFYHLTPVLGSSPPINQMDVDFIYVQMEQASWKASAGKSSVSHFSLDFSMTRTTATMSAQIVEADTAKIIASLEELTANDATAIAQLTKMKGVKT